MAAEAAELGTGARALVSVVERVCLPFERHLPSSDIRHLVITPEVVAEPRKHLQLVLAAPEDQNQRYEAAGIAERRELLMMIDRRQAMYAERIEKPLTTARMALIADEFYRVGMSMETAFGNVLGRLEQGPRLRRGLWREVWYYYLVQRRRRGGHPGRSSRRGD